MSRRVRTFIGLTVVLQLLLVASRLSSPGPVAAGDPCYHGFDIPAPSVEVADQIKVAPCAFAPTVAVVPVGARVTFFNGPGFTHLVTGADQAWGSRDVELQPGSTVTYAFDKPGVYPYACALHRGMSGTIVVGDAQTALALTGGAGVAGPDGTSGGTTTDPAIATTTPPAERPAPAGDTIAAPPVPAFLGGAVFGALVAGVAVWLAARRRSSVRSSVATPVD
jgi:plastocyanin